MSSNPLKKTPVPPDAVEPQKGENKKESYLDQTLRPGRWAEYIGQKNIKDNLHILLIDEIHRLNKAIEEILYPAMESGKLDIIIGKGPSARTIQLDLPQFTLI